MNERDIPIDWWVAQDGDIAWQRQLAQARYEDEADAMRAFAEDFNRPWQWEQLELPLDNPNKSVNPF